MAAPKRLVSWVAIPLFLTAVLTIGFIKGRRDSYAALRPLVIRDQILYMPNPVSGNLQSVRILDLKKFETSHIERLLQASAPHEQIVWHKDMGSELGIQYLAYITATIHGDLVVIDPNGYGPKGSVNNVEISHNLRWWEVLWVRASHPGTDPFK